MKYEEMISKLFSFHPEAKIKLGLERIEKLLEVLGNPQKDFKYIHVTGTNGKGTVTRTIGKLLSAHGVKTGTYFSPHLESFRERIRINDTFISQEDAVLMYETVSKAAEEMEKSVEMKPTFFEVVTAMAFLYFKIQGVDIVVSEVGMGGRFDATNVVDDPLCSVITMIDYDHTTILGSTLSQIAFEKSGIIKKNSPVITGEFKEEPLRVIRSRANELNSEVRRIGKDFRYVVKRIEIARNAFDFVGKRWKLSLETRMNGIAAINNITISLAVLEYLEEIGIIKMDPDLVYKTIFTIPWEGRFEWFPSDVTLILDVAHNPSAMEMLKKNLKLYFPDRKINGVVGILNDKDYKRMIENISPYFDKMYITSPKNERATDPFAVYSWAVIDHNNVGFVKEIEDATNLCLEMSKRENAVMVVTGSFYTVGTARTFLKGTGAEL
jgi:dihydrofolate synthase/folylpolyglutamate synthase